MLPLLLFLRLHIATSLNTEARHIVLASPGGICGWPGAPYNITVHDAAICNRGMCDPEITRLSLLFVVLASDLHRLGPKVMQVKHSLGMGRWRFASKTN